jgi:hypothetical protein
VVTVFCIATKLGLERAPKFLLTNACFWMLHGFIKRIRKIAESDHYLRLVRPSVRMVQLSFHWTDFHEI